MRTVSLPQIDRLSSLPNELLDHIFDLAHTLNHPSTGALSKRLLPFHISGLYRRIHLGKLANFGQLIRKVSREREYGERIRSLKIDQELQGFISRESFPSDNVASFFQSLSRLEDLDLAGDNFNWDEDDNGLLEAFDETSFLASETVMPSVVALRVEERFPVLWLRAFPSLVRFEYLHFDHNSFAMTYFRDSLVLPNLEYLSFTGVHADHPSIASFCSLCPKLLHLRLCVQDDYASYADLLPLLPTTLVSLELEIDREIRELIQVARYEGVEVDGNVFQALEVADAYLLEVANITVYRSFQDRYLGHIYALRLDDPHACGRLPPLDLDALDPKNLELVKTDLPDEGWFQLSLRNMKPNQNDEDDEKA
ncbi:hypothetical protein JCM11491_006081 [Sporobolomyces phaffii]